MLIENPYGVEQLVHRALQRYREGKEWFRCSTEEAIAAIQQLCGSRGINEVFKRADREKAERLRKEKEKAEAWKKFVDQLINRQEEEVRSRYEAISSVRFPEQRFWPYWLGCAFGFGIVISMFSTKMSDSGIFFLSVFFGTPIAFFVKEHVDAKRKESPEYKAFIQERESKFDEARTRIVISCSNCPQSLCFEVKQLLSAGNATWTCPTCKASFNPWQGLLTLVPFRDNS